MTRYRLTYTPPTPPTPVYPLTMTSNSSSGMFMGYDFNLALDSGYTYDFYINFDINNADGPSTTYHITTYNDVNLAHHYADDMGTLYFMEITGICESIGIAYTDASYASVLSWGEVGLKKIHLGGLNLLDTLPSGSTGLSNMEDFIESFKTNLALMGALPTLWTFFPLLDGTDCFAGCTNASNYGDVPTAWGGAV